ncbi:type II secretion system protein [Candidatus Daviesbacteria bacterium]|nr:type II secretion system protein [Candidatus Daviesbacteria bacterium]
MKKGFTLIELLVAVSILAILSTIGITAFQGTQSKARDTVRKNDLNVLATALEIYREQNGKYIVNSDGTNITTCPSSSDTTSPFYTQIAANLSTPAPKDPKTGSFYCYISVSNGQSFRLFAGLENCSGSGGNLCEYTNYNYTVISEDISLASAPSDSLIASAPTPTPSPSPTPTATTSPSPSASPTASPSPSPTPTPTATYTYIQTNVGCSTPLGLTPDQLCQREVSSTSRSQAVPGSSTIMAKGYWWQECGGASVSDCVGLDCTVNQLDCTNTPGFWGTQIPYPSHYLKTGNNITVFDPDSLGWSCDGFSPGWTMRVYCSR